MNKCSFSFIKISIPKRMRHRKRCPSRTKMYRWFVKSGAKSTQWKLNVFLIIVINDEIFGICWCRNPQTIKWIQTIIYTRVFTNVHKSFGKYTNRTQFVHDTCDDDNLIVSHFYGQSFIIKFANILTLMTNFESVDFALPTIYLIWCKYRPDDPNYRRREQICK